MANTIAEMSYDVMALELVEHDLCMECNPPSKPDDAWFAPLHCDTCKDTKRALFACMHPSESETNVVVCIQHVTHHVSTDGRKTELARTPLTRVCAALPKYLERYIGYDGCVVLPDYFKTRIVQLSPVDDAPGEYVTTTAIVMDVCLF